MKNKEFTPPTGGIVRSAGELKHAKKTLLALATLSALGMAAGPASAWDSTTAHSVDDNWELVLTSSPP